MNNIQIQTAFKVTDSQYYSTGCRTYQTTHRTGTTVWRFNVHIKHKCEKLWRQMKDVIPTVELPPSRRICQNVHRQRLTRGTVYGNPHSSLHYMGFIFMIVLCPFTLHFFRWSPHKCKIEVLLQLHIILYNTLHWNHAIP